jgi:hypothetical protein
MAIEINFIEKLMEARKKAQLQGRPLTGRETSGIVSGVAAAATDRLALAQQLKNQREQIAVQRDLAKLEKKKYRESKKGMTEEILGLGDPGGQILGFGPSGPASKIIKKGCIIISACTHPDSDEVNTARLYRDWVLDETTLTGYYLLSAYLAPVIYKYKAVKRFFKRYLVDRLMDYAEKNFYLAEDGYQFKTSKTITEGFLSLCKTLGNFTNFILRRYE